MTKDELALLGFTEEDVLNRLVDKLYEGMVETEECYAGEFGKRIEAALKKRVDEVISSAIKTHIEPKVEEMVNSVTLQQTNQWGEAKGEKLTFVEFLVQRVSSSLIEKVDYNGKSKAESDYNWRESTTRISYMIDRYLQSHIDEFMKKAFGEINSAARKGLEEAVKIALNNVKVQVTTSLK